MKKIILCLLATACSLSLVVHAQEKYAIQNYYMLDLNGSWDVKFGDNLKWAKPGLDTKSWNTMVIPNWDWSPGYDDFGWFRKDVLLPEKTNYFFNLGQVDDNCDVYFNGEQVKLYVSTAPNIDNANLKDEDQWKKYRSYYIPKKLVNTNKKNTIAIRVWDRGDEGGIRYGNIYISSTVFYNLLPVQLAGNWLKIDGSNEVFAGLYNNKAAYKGRLWSYGEITKESNELINITLINADKVEHLLLKEDASHPGSNNYLMGSDAAHLQVYNLKETNVDMPALAAPGSYVKARKDFGEAIYRGYIKDYIQKMGNEATIEIKGLNNKPYAERRIKINPDGSFAVNIDLHGPDIVYLHLPNVNHAIPAYIEQDKVTFLVIDPEEYKIYVTEDYDNRERLGVVMGDLVYENKLLTYISWLNSITIVNQDVWDKFLVTASRYAATGKANDMQMNNVALCIAENYQKYSDQEALKKAKIWSAQTLISEPDNHIYNSTFNAVLQNLGEHLEGLQYLAKALELADRNKDQESINDYKLKIKQYVGEMLK